MLFQNNHYLNQTKTWRSYVIIDGCIYFFRFLPCKFQGVHLASKLTLRFIFFLTFFTQGKMWDEIKLHFCVTNLLWKFLLEKWIQHMRSMLNHGLLKTDIFNFKIILDNIMWSFKSADVLLVSANTLWNFAFLSQITISHLKSIKAFM